jgi:hypothetical protein
MAARYPDAKIVEGNRGGKVLLYTGHKYHKNRTRAQSIYWRCWRTECRATLRTNAFDADDENANITVFNASQHTHENDDEMIQKEKTLNTLKAGVRANPGVPLKHLYDGVIRVLHQGGGDREHIPEFSRVRTSMERIRLEHVPPVPDTVDDVIINGSWGESWSNERHHLHQDNDWGILIFATDENLDNLRRCREVFVDATFRTAPAPYKQYFTIHGKFRNRILPFVGCLMTGKTVGQYRQILQAIKRHVREITGHRWRPLKVICDFEQALITAVETEMTTAEINGCYFHFGQSLWRQIQTLGLAGAYRRHHRLRKCIRKVMAIGYLPFALVRHNFRLLRTANRTQRLINRYPELQDFLLYFQRNYLDGNFPPVMWNVYDRNMDNRTNNHVESKSNKHW